MRLKLLLLYSSLFFTTLISSGQDGKNFKVLCDFPDYESIVEHFLKYHNISASGEENFYQFRFMRKPEGWFVIPEFYNLSGHTTKKEIEIWKNQSGFIIPPSKNPTEISLPEQYALVLNNNTRYDFVIQPFYGYVGWDEDVIDYFKRIKPSEMSDHELYGLSRAYSHRASNIFWAHSIYSDTDLVRSSKAKRSDIRKYLRLSYRSIKHLQELYFRNPDYKTLIGLSDIKLANQIMANWYELTLFGYYKKADKFINKTNPHYDDFWAKSSEYLLENLEKNAIFFTNGDNDTYPHLWNQATKNIRNDVLIINSSLLNDAEYFSLLCYNDQRFGQLATGLSKEEIKNLGHKYFIAINDTTKLQLSYAETENYVRQQSYTPDNKILMEYGYYSIPFLNEKLEPDTLVMLNATRRQISLQQFLLSGILYHHIGIKPIYFMKSMIPDFQKLFNPSSLLDEGMVIRLTNDAINYSGYYYSYYDSEKVSALLKASPVSLPDKKYPSRQRFFQLFLEMESRAISYDIDLNNSEKKQQEILDYLEQYPPYLTGLSLHYYNLIYTLFQADLDKDLAQMFLKAFIVELENQIRDTELMDSDPNDYLHLRRLTYIINSIIRSELDPGIPNFYENLFILERSINKKLRQMPEVKLD